MTHRTASPDAKTQAGVNGLQVIDTGANCGPTAEPRVGNYFVSAYPPFSCWTQDAVPDANRVLDQHARPSVELGIYVHVPFCTARCDYCYYFSHAPANLTEMDAYVTAVLREAEILARRRAIHERNLTFAYFGGGTPSVLPPQTLRRLFPGLKSRLPWNSINEITFECAPKSTTPERMTVARDIGVTRVSMGVQQMDDALLRRNGRIHLVRDVERAYTVLRRAGFEYVNLDFIAGLVGETDEAFHRSLDRLISLEPESITIYPLEVPRNTRLYRSWASVERDVATWSETRRRIKAGFGRLLSVGYSLRSAYTAVRDPRRYLFAYQDSQYRGADFVGLGPSSFSYVAGVHFQNTSSLTHYHEQISGNLLPLVRGYRLGGDEQFVREFVLQLKLGVVDRSYFADKFGIDVCQRFSAPLRALAANGDIMIGDRVLVLTLDGLVRVDRLMPLFYRNEHQAAPYW